MFLCQLEKERVASLHLAAFEPTFCGVLICTSPSIGKGESICTYMVIHMVVKGACILSSSQPAETNDHLI